MKTSKILFSIASFIAASALAMAANVTKVACVGDSITFGYLIPTKNSESYPIVLGTFLGQGYEVKNFGNPGKTAGDYPGQQGRWLGANREHRDCVDFSADIIISNLGINDTGAWWNADYFVAGYEKLIGQWIAGKDPKKSRKHVKYLMWTKLAPDFRGPVGKKAWPGNVFKGYSFPTSDNGTLARHDEIHALLAKIAKKTNAIGIDAYSALANHPEMYLKDGLHPNALGARRLAEITYAALIENGVIKARPNSPKVVPAKDGDGIVLKNAGKNAILLDGGALVDANGKKFVFEQATVIAPGSEIVVEIAGDADQKDPGSKLVSKSLKSATGVKFVPKK